MGERIKIEGQTLISVLLQGYNYVTTEMISIVIPEKIDCQWTPFDQYFPLLKYT